jgi:predicted glycosyltransferase
MRGADESGRHLAYFVSAHGYGHATRASAVMRALKARRPNLTIHVFTQAPEWIFTESVPGGWSPPRRDRCGRSAARRAE